MCEIIVKTITLVFKRSSLLDDIKNIGYIEGDSMKTDDEHERHLMMDIGEDGNVDRITRTMDLAFNECVNSLYPYAKTLINDGEILTDDFVESETYSVVLTIPEEFSKSTAVLVKEFIHDYMVSMAVRDWIEILGKDKYLIEVWTEKVSNLKLKIVETMNIPYCREKVRIKLHTF